MCVSDVCTGLRLGSTHVKAAPARILRVLAAVGRLLFTTLQPLPLPVRDAVLHEVRGDLRRCLLHRVVRALALEPCLLVAVAMLPLKDAAKRAAQRRGHVLRLAHPLQRREFSQVMLGGPKTIGWIVGDYTSMV